MRRRIAVPAGLILIVSVLGLVTRNMALFQLMALVPLFYSLFVFSVGAVAYHPHPVAPDEEVGEDEWPMVSILIPAHNEEFVIGNTLDHMLRLDYPRFEIIVIDDHSSDSTGAILRGYGVSVVTRRNLPNRGKSEALNAGLEVASGDVICVFDADSEVAPDFLRRAVLPLINDPEVCGVQSQVRMYNRRHNFLTAAQDDEFALYNELMQLGRHVMRGAAALGGNGQLTRRSAVRAVGGWSPASLTEDLDLTIRLFLAGRGRIAHCTEAIVWQEGVTSLSALIRQRTRWSEGMLRCWNDFAWAVLRSPNIAVGQRIEIWYSLVSAFFPLLTLFGVLYTVASWIPGLFVISLPTLYTTVMTVLLPVLACIWSLKVSYTRDRKFDVMPGLRYLIFNFHWTFALLCALRNVLQDQPIVWVKTEHRGPGLLHHHMASQSAVMEPLAWGTETVTRA